MILCASILSNKSLMEEATKCLFRTSIRSTHSTRICFTVSGTDKYHIQVSHHMRVGKNALNEYDQYAIYLAMLHHGAIDMFYVCSHLQ